MDPEALDKLRRSMDLTLDLEGRWCHDGRPFDNARIAELFSRGIDLHPDTGEPVVHIGHQWAYFTAEDQPFVARRLQISPGRITATLNTFAEVQLAPDALFSSEEGVIYARLDDRRVARLSRDAHAQLVPLVQEDGDGLAIVAEGVRWPISAP